ncbi:YfmQ family protein [Neobacillus terrae]|uniref:YfmQ family protein n=1 Tax=Neobacillus terrae TaxID=3034837 RepID=UPI0014077E18|nr:YfmQ family protein [Neobacillus terrae]NHM30842.1 hypothetical protein [Neobacillus terrae]
MTWAVVVSIILISLVKILMTCLPTGIVEWLISNFEVHSKLKSEDVTITLGDRHLEGQSKIQIIHDFNNAAFLERNYIWPGNEQVYLNPENSGTRLVIDTKRGKKDVRLFVFIYNDRIDVVKKFKKKLQAYSLDSENLQKLSLKEIGNAI